MQQQLSSYKIKTTIPSFVCLDQFQSMITCLKWMQVALTDNKNLDRDGSQMNTACCAKLHESLSGLCESAGSGMNKAFGSKDLPRYRTTWMEHHQTPLPFYGKGHVERELAGFIQSRVVLLLPYEQS